jgi:serine/threonine-protein kinase SRPK3
MAEQLFVSTNSTPMQKSFTHSSPTMASILTWARDLIWRPASPPMHFPTTGFELIDESDTLEEEGWEEIETGDFYPVNIGDILDTKYQVVGKLGFGTTSTVWLARDLQYVKHKQRLQLLLLYATNEVNRAHKFVALKVYTREAANKSEFETYKQISKANVWHRGYPCVMTALDIFTLPREGGDHSCLVLKPMWGNLTDLLNCRPDHRLNEGQLKVALKHILLALDYLHTECKLIHTGVTSPPLIRYITSDEICRVVIMHFLTDISSHNILIEIEESSLLEDFVKAEMELPSGRKSVNEAPVYVSRRFGTPKRLGRPVLGDFGCAVSGTVPQSFFAVQPDVYTSPECMLSIPWSYPVDIWNVGCMVSFLATDSKGNRVMTEKQIWDLFEDKHLFNGYDHEHKEWRTRAQLAEVIGMLGPPPLDMLERAGRRAEFFDEKGTYSYFDSFVNFFSTDLP